MSATQLAARIVGWLIFAWTTVGLGYLALFAFISHLDQTAPSRDDRRELDNMHTLDDLGWEE